MAIKVKIGSRFQENLERVKGLVKLAAGNDALEGFVHVYSDNEKKIVG